MKLQFKILFLLVLCCFINHNLSGKEKVKYIPVIDEQYVNFIKFELDNSARRIPIWQESSYIELSPMEEMGIPPNQQVEKVKEERRQRWEKRVRLEKQREIVDITKVFDVMYIRGSMYFIRVFYEEITESEFYDKTSDISVVKTNLKHALDYGHFAEFLPEKEPYRTFFQQELTKSLLIVKKKDTKRFFKILYYDALYNYDNSTHNFVRRYNLISFQRPPKPIRVRCTDESKSIYFSYFHETVLGQVRPLHYFSGGYFPPLNSVRELIQYKVLEVNQYECITEYTYNTPNMQYFLVSTHARDYPGSYKDIYWNFNSIEQLPYPYKRVDIDSLPLFSYRYIPGIAYYPDMFKLKSINGKSLEEFSLAYCDDSYPDDKILSKGLYPSLREQFPDQYPDPGPRGWVRKFAQFPGGDTALAEYLNNPPYPEVAIQKGLTGKVSITFVIDDKGNVLNPRIVMSSTHPILDEAALTHIKNMPDWKPATGERYNEDRFPSTKTLTVKFNLTQNEKE